jgi:hypothetical protein
MLYAFLGVALLFGVWWLTRAGELFYLSVHDGRVLVIRGRAPAGFVRDARDVVGGVRRATICAMKEEHGARLFFSGDLDEAGAQRLRNLFGLYPASRLRQAPAIARPTLGQVLGVTWLAWLLDRTR